MAEVVYNRYRSISKQVETWMELNGPLTVYPGGTVVAPADSELARSRSTVIVQRNVPQHDYAEQEDLEDFSDQEDETPQVPQHDNDNLTNTDPGEGRTILTDAFDGSGGRGAVNTSAAHPVGTQPETPKPPADLSPKVTEEEAKDEKKGKTVRGK